VGRAAVAVVLVAGRNATRLISDSIALKSRRPLSEVPLNRIALGNWGDLTGEEVVVCRRTSDEIEIHCHGGSAAVQAVIRRLCKCGGKQLTWQKWLQRSAGDPLRAAAQIALSNAPTARVASVLLDQYHGALTAAIHAAVAANLAGDLGRSATLLDQLLAWEAFGMHLTLPWRVVLAGQPNVGKSSLINALVGFDRSIVSATPGTTRDVVTATAAIAGWPLQLADTAGLRETEDELESAGVELATDTLRKADLVLLVQDARMNGDAADEQERFVEAISQHLTATRIIRVLNKVDLVQVRSKSSATQSTAIYTSAVTGAGISELINKIAELLVPAVPAPGEAVPFAAEQFAAIRRARNAIDAGNPSALPRLLQSILPCRAK
jgi:tRNA modification GTPase